MKIVAVKIKAGIPCIELLCVNYNNSIHENHIEIARRYWLVEPNERKAIILIHNDNEYGNSFYTATDFRNTYHNPLTPSNVPLQ